MLFVIGGDVKLGWFYLILGIILLIVLIFFGIRDAIRGVRSVNGIVFGKAPDEHDFYIRYKIRGTCYEVSCSSQSSYFKYFMPDPPDVGLKIVLRVRKDDPYEVVSIYPTLHTKLTSFSKDSIYSNNYVWKIPLIILSLSAFFITIGVVFITGIL